MVKKVLPEKVTAAVREYIKVLRADHLPIKQVLVFGSYAKGTARPDSDIDVCVVSPRFRDTIDAMMYLWSKRRYEHDPSVEPIGFTAEDLRDETGLTNEIRRYGVSVRV